MGITARPVPGKTMLYLLELQRDWARTGSYGSKTGIAKHWGGAYGLGINYAKTMFGGQDNAEGSGVGIAPQEDARQ